MHRKIFFSFLALTSTLGLSAQAYENKQLEPEFEYNGKQVFHEQEQWPDEVTIYNHLEAGASGAESADVENLDDHHNL